MNVFDPVKHWAAASGKWATKSILNSALHIAMVTTPLSLVLAFLSSYPMNYMYFALGCVPIIFCMTAYALFSIYDPDRLQSEEHIIRKEVVAKIGNEHLGQLLIVDQDDVAPNPALEDR